MSPSVWFRAQACNNAFANHRLLAVCGALSAEALAAPRAGFFPSIIATLNHILIVDWFYVSALEGDCVGPAVFELEVPCPDFADLEREQRAVDRRLIAVSGREDVGRIVTLLRAAGPQRERADRVLLHLFQHQVHHRGQVHAMLSGAGVAPPQLDEFFLADERNLRAGELATLAIDEDALWR